MGIAILESKAEVKFWGGTMPYKPIMIVISGLISAGKTTTADFMVKFITENFPDLEVVKTAFAKAVKDCAFDIFGWDWNKDARGRKLLQDIGRIGREYNENIWADKLIDYLDESSYIEPDIVIIDDWRFPNELERIKEIYPCYPVTIRVIRPGCKVDDDLSERSLDDNGDFTYKINNSSTLDELEISAISIVNDVLSNYKLGG